MRSRELLFAVLPRTRYGELILVTPEGTTHRFVGDHEHEEATIILKDWRAVDAILSRGDIGLGESYMAHLWETPDLQSLLTFCQRNRDEFARRLFRMSSTLPPSMQVQAREASFDVNDRTRGFVFNADLASVVRFLDIGTPQSYAEAEQFFQAAGTY